MRAKKEKMFQKLHTKEQPEQPTDKGTLASNDYVMLGKKAKTNTYGMKDLKHE